MIKRIVEFGLAAAILAFCLFPAWAAGQSSPHVFFTDLISGPNTGGENNNGTILTIYGTNFGTTQGNSTVTVGGGQVATYLQWGVVVGGSSRWPTNSGLQKIAVAIGSAAATGPVVVSTGAGSSNTSVIFTVRAGIIRCVSTTGSDSNDGHFPSEGAGHGCWATVSFAVHTGMAPGDIVYALDGVKATGSDPLESGTECTICLDQNGGTASAPSALVAYPNATVTIGDATANNPNAGIRQSGLATNADYWTVANIHAQGDCCAFSIEQRFHTGWRIVGNDLYCPYQDQGSPNDGCFEEDNTTGGKFLGNIVHDSGTLGNPSKQRHHVYWSTDSNHVECAWNAISGGTGASAGACRGVQFHSSPTGGGSGLQQYDLHVHDNYIHDVRCDAINFATVDPSKGPVEAYNNILVHVGEGPDPVDGSANYAGVYVPNTLNAGSACSSGCIVNVYNNTIYDAGAPAEVAKGAGALMVESGPDSTLARNNIIYQLPGEAYINGGGASGTVTCDTDDWFGLGPAPSFCTSSLNVDPQFANIGARDFHLVSGSPVVDKGLTISSLITDFDGNSRPQGPAFDMGAYELVQGTVQRPNPPTNLQVTVK